MAGLTIKHKKDYMQSGITLSDGSQSLLLMEEEDCEALIEDMPKGTIGYLYTIHENVFEFSYLLKGKMELKDKNRCVTITQGDIYAHHTLEDKVMFHVIEDVQILNVNTKPYYTDYQDDEDRLMDILREIQKVDGDTLEHCMRVRKLSMGIAYFMDFDPAKITELYYAANFHDVGKAKIPTEILLKPAKLSDAEYEIMKTHSRYTYEMILEEYGEEIASYAFEHHENLDGSGYPRGLMGDEISLPARIICVADAYDAMTVTRPYRSACSKEVAFAELQRCEGSQFDGKVIKALKKYVDSLEK